MCVDPAMFVIGSSFHFSHSHTYINTHTYTHREGVFLPLVMMQVKTGPFAEHSNTLWGISSVAEWTKVNSGLIKMYKAEVCCVCPLELLRLLVQ